MHVNEATKNTFFQQGCLRRYSAGFKLLRVHLWVYRLGLTVLSEGSEGSYEVESTTIYHSLATKLAKDVKLTTVAIVRQENF